MEEDTNAKEALDAGDLQQVFLEREKCSMEVYGYCTGLYGIVESDEGRDGGVEDREWIAEARGGFRIVQQFPRLLSIDETRGTASLAAVCPLSLPSFFPHLLIEDIFFFFF